VAKESVQVIESEPFVSVSNSEPTQNLKPCDSDQPSSSSQIQTLNQPPINILEPDYLEDQLVEINDEMQTLVLLRKTPFLPFAYQEKWSAVKNRAFDLINDVAKKCCRIQAHAMKCRMQDLHSSQQLPSKLLYLTNAPFYVESEYVTRESKVFKMLKQKVLKQQEE